MLLFQLVGSSFTVGRSVRDISIKDTWDATMKGIRVLNNDSEYRQRVYKYDHDWAKQISDLSEDEFTAECKLREACSVDLINRKM